MFPGILDVFSADVLTVVHFTADRFANFCLLTWVCISNTECSIHACFTLSILPIDDADIN